MRTLHTILITSLAVLHGAFYGMACRAEVLEYDIEIVFFEDITNRYSNSEQWGKIESDLPPAITHPYENQADENLATNIIENEVNSLEKYITRLEKSTRYNVLTHKAWRQAGLDAESAIDIYIDSTENKITRNKLTSTADTDANSSIAKSSIKGTVKIILGRYLHVYTDMIYQKPNSLYAPVESPIDNKRYKEYLIKSHRRMRSNELHYIDHPLVGMLVMAQPVELPETELPEVEIEETEIEQKLITSN
jgi:hypothetical protein